MRSLQRWPRWLAAALGLTLLGAVAYAGSDLGFTPLLADSEPPTLSPEQAKRLTHHTRMITVAGLMLIGFLVVSFVLMRLGRAMMGSRRGAKRTEYVDAWGAYRISEEEIDRVAPRAEGEGGVVDELEYFDEDDEDTDDDD
ncbi:MAG: hypothetical protein KDA32_09855 [Phycisphaerales bacterium]|nr:hypothetical protein [Phycisphaerales bacterium]